MSFDSAVCNTNISADWMADNAAELAAKCSALSTTERCAIETAHEATYEATQRAAYTPTHITPQRPTNAAAEHGAYWTALGGSICSTYIDSNLQAVDTTVEHTVDAGQYIALDVFHFNNLKDC